MYISTTLKNNILIIFLIVQSIISFGQKQESINFLETDSTWQKEIFNFPLRFAQEIKYEGKEDARFPEGWANIESPNFWSYVFGWNINFTKKLTKRQIEADLQLYFDGLMNIKIRSKNENIPNTRVLLTKENSSTALTTYFGTVNTNDSFFTKKPMTLHVMVEISYCEQQMKTLILFRFSPKEFGDTTWDKLKKVKFYDNICDLYEE